ncbi:MAG: alanine dehydrogenase, partial [Desulfobacterales bacterium]
MIIGVPKEIKKNESRVSITPPAVDALVSKGHQIIIETQAGVGSEISNEDYSSAGAMLSPDAKTVFQKGEMILKVKELFP